MDRLKTLVKEINNTKMGYFKISYNLVQAIQSDYQMDFSSFIKMAEKPQAKGQTFSGFSGLLKNTMNNKFMTFFDEMVKPSLQRNEQQIASTYKKINNFIEQVHSHIQKQLEKHEQEVFQIIKEEMKQAHREVRKLAGELNKKITLRNENQEVWFLSNQLDYFKNQALKLFSDNKELRVQNKLLVKTVKDYEIQLENLDLTLQKIKKKSMKQKNIKRTERPVQSMRESSALRLKTKDSIHNKKRMMTELSSIMRTEVERQGKEFEDSRINIQLSNSSNFQNSNSVSKHIKNGPILITLDDEDKLVENVTIPNLSAQSHKAKRSQLSSLPQGQSFLQQRVILQCIDKYTQTHLPQTSFNRNESIDEVDASKTQYGLDLFKNGFKFNETYIKAKRIQIPLRSSVDYDKSGMCHIRSMNSSILRNRLEDSYASKNKKKSSLFKQAGLYPAK